MGTFSLWKFIQRYTYNLCSFLYVYDASIKINVKIRLVFRLPTSFISSKLATKKLNQFKPIFWHHFQRNAYPAQDSLEFQRGKKITQANSIQGGHYWKDTGKSYQSEGQDVLLTLMRIWTLARFMIWLCLTLIMTYCANIINFNRFVNRTMITLY